MLLFANDGTDDGESEEGRTAGEADCFWENNQTIRDLIESWFVGLLLSVCKGGRVGRAKE
jgi:hypothetical protein